MSTAPPAPVLSTARRSWSLGLLFAIVALNLFDRQVINVLAQDIKVELDLSDARLGLLTGTAFGLLYAIAGLPIGRLADRFDRSRLLALMVAVWSGFTLLCGIASSFATLAICRMGVGIGEAGSQPSCTALVPDLFPERQRSTALAVLLAGAPFGSFLGLLIGGAVAQHWGWRAAFFAAGLPGILLAVLLLLAFRDPRSQTANRPLFEGSLFAAIIDVARKPTYLWLCGALVGCTFLIYGSGAWLPAFFQRVHGLTTAQVGGYTALGVGLGGGLGTLFSGILCDLLRGRVHFPESKVLIALLVISIPSLLVALLSPDLRLALVGLFLFNSVIFAWLAPLTRLIQAAVGPAHYALAIALCSTFATVLSLAAGVPLIGGISDLLTPAAGVRAVGYAIALTLPAAALFAIIANLVVLKMLRRRAMSS